MPVPYSEARAWLHLSHDEDAPLITGLLKSAQSHVERFTGCAVQRRVIHCTIQAEDFRPQLNLRQNQFALPIGPVSYSPSPILVREEEEFPANIVRGLVDVVEVASAQIGDTIRYTAGFPGTVPATFKTAMLLIVAHFYTNREASSLAGLKELPMGTADLLRPFCRGGLR